MNFIVRSVRHDDLNQLVDLAKQFTLLNLPGEKSVISNKIERSINSFAGKVSGYDAEFLFVLEDLEERQIVGSSLIIAKHGSDQAPHCFFKILKRDHFSKDLGIGFIHQVLRFQMDTDGPTEIGGLLIDRSYRRRPEKLGKQISLSRFVYMGMYRDRFESRVLCELTPPLTEEGRSEFWEALGRRFTGLPYQEADLLSQTHKEFIESLFPEEDIYLSLLASKARLVLGRVGEATKPAQHLLESIGFKYLDEVDPFDGGPHFGCDTDEIGPVKMGKKFRIADFANPEFSQHGFLATYGDEFSCMLTSCDIRDDEIAVPSKIMHYLNLEKDQEVYFAPSNYKMNKE